MKNNVIVRKVPQKQHSYLTTFLITVSKVVLMLIIFALCYALLYAFILASNGYDKSVELGRTQGMNSTETLTK